MRTLAVSPITRKLIIIIIIIIIKFADSADFPDSHSASLPIIHRLCVCSEVMLINSCKSAKTGTSVFTGVLWRTSLISSSLLLQPSITFWKELVTCIGQIRSLNFWAVETALHIGGYNLWKKGIFPSSSQKIPLKVSLCFFFFCFLDPFVGRVKLCNKDEWGCFFDHVSDLSLFYEHFVIFSSCPYFTSLSSWSSN